MFHIHVNGNSAARIIIKLNAYEKLALIDTGAGKCCMSEHQYVSIGSPPLKLPNSVLRTALGAELAVLGTTTCTVWIGGYVYVHPFIVCKELAPAIILGRDFLSAHKIKIAWGHGV